MSSTHPLARRIKSAMILRGYKTTELAIKMHMTYGQLTRRLRNPGMIKVEELERLERVLKTKFFTTE